jgi:hypothetical protein
MTLSVSPCPRAVIESWSFSLIIRLCIWTHEVSWLATPSGILTLCAGTAYPGSSHCEGVEGDLRMKLDDNCCPPSPGHKNVQVGSPLAREHWTKLTERSHNSVDYQFGHEGMLPSPTSLASTKLIELNRSFPQADEKYLGQAWSPQSLFYTLIVWRETLHCESTVHNNL